MTEAAAKTGMGPTICMAVERFYPREQRIVDDGLAYRMLPRRRQSAGAAGAAPAVQEEVREANRSSAGRHGDRANGLRRRLPKQAKRST